MTTSAAHTQSDSIGHDAKVVQAIAEAIGSALSPQCVILFGSRARGDHQTHSDVDLAVIASQTELDVQQRYDLRQQAHGLAETVSNGRFRRIDIIIWTETQYRTKKRSINHVAGRAWREGVILYGVHQTLPGEEIVSELDNARELMRMCRAQIRALYILLNSDVEENIFGFHAQRASELALKAWISLAGERYERTHSIIDLAAIINNAGVPEVQRFAHLITLSPYAVKYVYEAIEDPTMDRQYVADEVNALADFVDTLVQQAESESGPSA